MHKLFTHLTKSVVGINYHNAGVRGHWVTREQHS